jgi:hypothetical protein
MRSQFEFTVPTVGPKVLPTSLAYSAERQRDLRRQRPAVHGGVGGDLPLPRLDRSDRRRDERAEQGHPKSAHHAENAFFESTWLRSMNF